MTKIFIAFYNGIKNKSDASFVPLFYEGLIDGLKTNGNDVFSVMYSDWNMKFEEIPQNLLQEIKEFNPDLIFLFNNYFYDLSAYFDCPIVVYEVDSPICYFNQDKLKSNPNRYHYFISKSSSADILISDYGVLKENIVLVPFFTSIQAENVEHKYNISFIGSKFVSSIRHIVNKFMDSNPTDDERLQYEKLLQTVQDNPFISLDKLFMNINSEKILSNFDHLSAVALLSDYKRTKVLSNVADLGLDIWGTPNWATDPYNEPWLILKFHKEPVYSIKHNQDIYNSSKIGISVAHLQDKQGFPWRIFDIMASNACLVTEYHGDFQKYMPNLKLPYYSNPYEAREICKKLLQDENWRLDLVSQSQEIVNKNFRFKNTLEIIENFLNMKLSENQAIQGAEILKDLKEFLPPPTPPAPAPTPKPAPPKKPTPPKPDVKKLGFKNKIRYKIWKHFDKILRRKGII